MTYQYRKRTINAFEFAQHATLRLTKQLIDEHKRLDNLDNLCDKRKYVVHNINKQENLTLNIQLRISISNLQVDNVPTGRFLLCRVISRFVKLYALLALVEDPEGNVERFALYNWTNIPKEGQSNIKSINQLFLPIGTLLVIKNISYEYVTGNITIIRSNNPDDVIIVDQNNKSFSDVKWSTNEKKVEIKNADDFHRCGNDYFSSSNYIAANYNYSNGIKLEPQNVTLLINRAETCLRLYQFHNALKDTEIALMLYYNTSIKQIMEHAEMLSYENKNGKYDYLRIFDEFYERSKIKKDSKGNDVWIYETGPRLDHADFLNDNIKIELVEGKGRGWIAKCDIPEYTLLMVSKAFKVVFSNEVFGTMISDTQNDDSLVEELTTCITLKLIAEPYYCQEVYQLYDGLNLSENEKIELINKNEVNINLIVHTLLHNDFGLNYNEFNLKTEITGTGLCILPSLFNHACIDENVNHFFLGDLIFLRTNRPISKGEELIINYRNFAFCYEERLVYLKTMMNIDCQCRLCKLERSESQEIRLRMRELLKIYNESIKPKLLESHNVDPSLIKELEDIIAKLSSLRKEHPDLEFNTMELRIMLGYAYRKSGNNKKALSILKEAYDLYKTICLSQIRVIINNILIISLELELFEEAKKWVDIILKIVVEPIMGKLEDDKPEWRKEALRLTEKIYPKINSFAETLEIV
ncbi:19104_t:CDS:2 [Rhizophagus irregularis]|nr:19104_t:CDS:2 [Rhizophagus irregularis]